MKKGLIALFAAMTFACAGSIFAAAPTIGAIPDVSIGDLDPPEATQFTDSNFFVFTNAFNFDNAVNDADNNDVDLKWSFDEGNDPAPLTGATRWYNINGKAAMHCGASDMAGDPLYAAHVTPGDSNDLRKESAGGSAWASFRDVIFSPNGGSLPFPLPTGNAKTAHEAGKLVYFAVSDGQNVTTKAITVRTVDNTRDAISGGSPYDPYSDDKFDTQVSGDWTAMGATKDMAGNGTYDYVTGAYRLREVSLAANKYTNVGWQGNRAKWILYSAVGSENYVRAKFYIYAQSDGTGWSVNTIPAFAMRVSYRTGFCVQQLVNPHDPLSANCGVDIRPTTNPSAPSIYRVDFDPVDVPYLATFSSGTNTEGICPIFELQEQDITMHGYMCMTEQSFGTYPASYLTGTPVQSKSWNGTTNAQAGDMHNWDGASYTTMQLIPLGAGDYICGPDPGPAMVRTESTAGITITGLSTNTYIGSGEYILFVGNTTDGTPAYGQRIRVMENLIYKARYHLTSSQTATLQSELWFGPRALNAAYLCRAQFSGGAFNLGGYIGNLQALPSTTCLNPDKLGAETNGGWYTVIMNTPYSLDIRPDATGDIAARMPNIAAQRPYGDNGGASRRDVKLTIQMWDSIPLGAVESGQVVLDRATLEAYPQFDDSAL